MPISAGPSFVISIVGSTTSVIASASSVTPSAQDTSTSLVYVPGDSPLSTSVIVCVSLPSMVPSSHVITLPSTSPSGIELT